MYTRNETNSTGFDAGHPYVVEERTADVSVLRPHPANTYAIDEASIASLADNIGMVGLIEQPFVREVGDGGLQILSGHRRVRALKRLAADDPKWAEVTVRCAVGMSDPDALLVLHSANIFRSMSQAERLRQSEELEAEIAALRPDHPEWQNVRTREIIAQMLGVPSSTFSRKLSFARNLLPDLYDLYDTGMMSSLVASDLARQDEAYQKRFLRYVKRKKPRDKKALTACYDRFTVSPGKLVAGLGSDLRKLRVDLLEFRTIYEDEGIAVDVDGLKEIRDGLDELIALVETSPRS